MTSSSSEILHFPLQIASVAPDRCRSGSADFANPDSVTPTTLISRAEISETPGADRTNSLAMVTDYTAIRN